jgi:DNA replication and repair protein RecF
MLTNFRSYADLDLRFARSSVIFLGDNAQGKTNLLEAIALLATGISPFAAREAELIRWDADQAIIRSVVDRELGATAVDLLFRSGGRRAIRVNGVYQRRAADLLGTVMTVCFSVEDLQLVKGAPALRRRYLDGIAAQLGPTYYQATQHYQRVLLQRNNALRAIAEGGMTDLEIWDVQLVRYGAEIWRRRRELVAALAGRAQDWHAQLSSGHEELSMRLVPGLEGSEPDWAGAFSEQLREGRAREVARGQTLVGPHRDDLELAINGREAKAFASQGQQRTVVLALKLAELDVFRAESGESPLLLLDDVLAELDIRRQNALLAAIGGEVQTFVTSTHLSDFTADWIDAAEIFSVAGGAVRPFSKAF